MKKKGLIISTIIMVVVLAASLTTATYAWFTQTDSTTITGFDVEIKPNNAVNIGVKINNDYDGNATADSFRTGSVTLSGATDGQLFTGSWGGGSLGLGPQLTHNIVWGQQNKAIGFASSAQTITDGALAKANLTPIATASTHVYAANGDDASANLSNVTAAKANGVSGASAVSGDYAYLFLGVQPTKALDTCELIILVDGTDSTGSTCGILSAIHVAYRVNSDGAWTDTDVFGADDPSAEPAVVGKHYYDELSTATLTWTTEQDSAYDTAYRTGNEAVHAPTTKAGRCIISIPNKAQGNINQVELLIYIDGNDSDCNIYGLTAKGSIKMFFNTVAQTQQQNNG